MPFELSVISGQIAQVALLSLIPILAQSKAWYSMLIAICLFGFYTVMVRSLMNGFLA
jgi:hypothetical protein